MKTVISADSIFSPLLSSIAALAASVSLSGYSEFELEGGTLRGLRDGIVVEDRYIGDAALASFYVQIAQIQADKKTADETARANAPKSQEARVILSRLTNPEISAIFGSVDPLVIKFRSIALAVGSVQSNDPDAIAGFGYLIQQGLLAVNRPAELLAPTP